MTAEITRFQPLESVFISVCGEYLSPISTGTAQKVDPGTGRYSKSHYIIHLVPTGPHKWDSSARRCRRRSSPRLHRQAFACRAGRSPGARHRTRSQRQRRRPYPITRARIEDPAWRPCKRALRQVNLTDDWLALINQYSVVKDPVPLPGPPGRRLAVEAVMPKYAK